MLELETEDGTEVSTLYVDVVVTEGLVTEVVVECVVFTLEVVDGMETVEKSNNSIEPVFTTESVTAIFCPWVIGANELGCALNAGTG